MKAQLKQYRPEFKPNSSSLASLEFPEASFLDITVHAMTESDLQETISVAIETGKKWLIANHNLHSLYLLHKEAKERVSTKLRDFYKRAKWTHIDGMSMVMLARLNGHSMGREHRLPYNYTLRTLMALSEQEGWRVFYLGSSEFVAKQAAKTLQAEFPDLMFANRHGFFAKEKESLGNQQVLAEIRAFRPHILYVGMGMPHQEQWIEENYDDLSANVIMHTGAALDYVAHALPTPPKWVGNAGMEWSYRLFNEPGRLGFRYLAEPWLILVNVLQTRAFRFLRMEG